MTRYVIRKGENWSVVNAHYKRILKSFSTQKEAILYAQKLESTTSIILQGKDNKFRRVTNWDTAEKKEVVVKYVPLYIYKSTDQELYNAKIKEYILFIFLVGFALIAAIFFTMYGVVYHE